MAVPIHYEWNGDIMRPLPRFASKCDEVFVVGERYVLEPVAERTRKAHAHYFACMNEAWETLPDNVAIHFPSADHLRKAALCRTGFATSITVPCETIKAARKFAIECRKADAFAIVDIAENVVTMWTAESQSYRAMGKVRFQESKTLTLDWVARKFGYQPQQLGQAA